MKVYLTALFRGKADKQKIKDLSHAVHEAGMDDFWFVRDVEHYKHMFDKPKEKWLKIYDELGACDMLLVDVSSGTNSRRAIEIGMALALKKPIILTVKKGIKPKNVFTETASTVIEYETYKDIISPLKKYDKERNFNITDKMMLLAVLVLFGLGSAWWIGQYFLLLGFVWAVVYWLVIRRIFPMMKLFDRLVIYIPLAAIWLGGIMVLYPISALTAWGWALIFWFGALIILRKLKFSL